MLTHLIHKIKTFIGLLFDSDKRFLYLAQKGFYAKIPDEQYIKRMYKAKLGKELNLNEPKTFNEKLQWIKLFDRKPEYTTMVDKYLAKDYVANIIGNEYIIPTIGVWEKAEDIDFDNLPNKFVLKTTHDSGGIKIVDKSSAEYNEKELKKFFRKRLKRSLYSITREWPYKNVKPRIIAEKYMENNGEELCDYKVHNFNGIPKVILVCRDRFGNGGLKEDFYSETWVKTTA